MLARVRAWIDHYLGAQARERAGDFAWHLWQRFRDDKCFEAAGALSYTTLFALVPLTTAVFGVIAAFPVFKDWTDRLQYRRFESLLTGADAFRHSPEYLRLVREIDTLNILRATLLAMRRAVEALPLQPVEALVDGNQCPTLACPVHAIV